MCDQVVVLLSPEYSASIVWHDDENNSESGDLYSDDTDRMFTFEVSKTNEQEENAVVRPGFQVSVSFVVEISFLTGQRCISVTFHVIQTPKTVQLTQRSSRLVYCQAKLCKAF